MPQFKTHEEYDQWRSEKALKRDGANTLRKMDQDSPAPEKRSGRWGWLTLFFLVLCVSGYVLFGTDIGRGMFEKTRLLFHAVR